MHISYTGAQGPAYLVSIESGDIPEIDQLYRAICKAVRLEGLEAAPRGLKILEILNCSFTLENPRSRVVTSAFRSVKPRYLVGELIWYLTGERKISRILKYSSFWKNLVDAEGNVNSNYGDLIWHRDFSKEAAQDRFMGPDCQFRRVIDELVRDPDSRRAIISIHTQQASDANPKDVPCTLNLQFFIRENKLHLSVMMRSNDLVFGFCNDVFQFTMIQEIMLSVLRGLHREKFGELELGSYHHHAGSMHVYERHFEVLKSEVFQEFTPDPTLTLIADLGEMPDMDILKFIEFKNHLVEAEDSFNILQPIQLHSCNYARYICRLIDYLKTEPTDTKKGA